MEGKVLLPAVGAGPPLVCCLGEGAPSGGGGADLHQGRAGGGRGPWFARARGKGGAGASA
jgi:hypothetical protein